MVIITNDVVYSVTKATFRTLQRSNMDHLANVVNGFYHFLKKLHLTSLVAMDAFKNAYGGKKFLCVHTMLQDIFYKPKK